MDSSQGKPPLRQAPTLKFDPLTDIEWKLLYELNYELDDRMQSMTFRHVEVVQQRCYAQTKNEAANGEQVDESVGFVRLGMRFPNTYYESVILPQGGETDVITKSIPIEISTMAGQSIVEHLSEIRECVEALPKDYFYLPELNIDELRKENDAVEKELQAEIEKSRQFAKELDKYRRKIVLQRFMAADSRQEQINSNYYSLGLVRPMDSI